MTWLQLVIGHLSLLAMALAVTGLVLRGHAGIARFFTAYLAFAFVADALVLAWPARFWTWSFWLFKETVYDALELAIAFEVARFVFLGFPGAARSARGAMFLLLVATFLAVVALPMSDDKGAPLTLMAGLRPRLELGIAWLFVAIAGLMRWYDLPSHPIHRAIMLGMAVQLAIFGLFVHALGVLGLEWATGEPLVTLAPAAFTGVCFWWARVAWQRETVAVGREALLEQLQPWRVAP